MEYGIIFLAQNKKKIDSSQRKDYNTTHQKHWGIMRDSNAHDFTFLAQVHASKYINWMHWKRRHNFIWFESWDILCTWSWHAEEKQLIFLLILIDDSCLCLAFLYARQKNILQYHHTSRSFVGLWMYSLCTTGFLSTWHHVTLAGSRGIGYSRWRSNLAVSLPIGSGWSHSQRPCRQGSGLQSIVASAGCPRSAPGGHHQLCKCGMGNVGPKQCHSHRLYGCSIEPQVDTVLARPGWSPIRRAVGLSFKSNIKNKLKEHSERCTYFTCIHGNGCKIVWILLVPCQAKQRCVCWVLIDDGRMLQVTKIKHSHRSISTCPFDKDEQVIPTINWGSTNDCITHQLMQTCPFHLRLYWRLCRKPPYRVQWAASWRAHSRGSSDQGPWQGERNHCV